MAMARGRPRNIYFTEETDKKLTKFVEERFGKHRAVSMIVQKAVEEYIERHEKSDSRTY